MTPIISPEFIKKYEDRIFEIINNFDIFENYAFVGAGLSNSSGYPLGKDLINLLKKTTKEKGGNLAPKHLDWQKEAQFYRDELNRIDSENGDKGEISYFRFIEETFKPNNKFKSTHKELSEIKFESFITTNYDKCLENVPKVPGSKQTYFYYPYLNPANLKNKNIFHIHGMVDDDGKKNIVFTHEDYIKAYEENNDIKTFLVPIFETHSVLFFGFSLGDPEVSRIIKFATEIRQNKIDEIERQNINLKYRDLKHYSFLQYPLKSGTGDIDYDKTLLEDREMEEKNIFPIRFYAIEKDYSNLTDLIIKIGIETSGIEYSFAKGGLY